MVRWQRHLLPDSNALHWLPTLRHHLKSITAESSCDLLDFFRIHWTTVGGVKKYGGELRKSLSGGWGGPRWFRILLNLFLYILFNISQKVTFQQRINQRYFQSKHKGAKNILNFEKLRWKSLKHASQILRKPASPERKFCWKSWDLILPVSAFDKCWI